MKKGVTVLKLEGTNTELLYRNAIRATEKCLQECSQKVASRYGGEPILSVSDRIKTPESIQKKLGKKGYDQDTGDVLDKLNDIAGVRVVCGYLDDIYRIRRELRKHPEFVILKEKDYIRHPRKSGYRSLHIIGSVSVSSENGIQDVKVEIQLRTLVMHLWAELDHDRYYKKQKKEESLDQILKSCAKMGKKLDVQMQKARKQMDLEEKAERERGEWTPQTGKEEDRDD